MVLRLVEHSRGHHGSQLGRLVRTGLLDVLLCDLAFVAVRFGFEVLNLRSKREMLLFIACFLDRILLGQSCVTLAAWA